MHAWFLGCFGTRGPVPWLFILITSQWLLKVAMMNDTVTVENDTDQQMLSGVRPIPRRCHCAWCLLGTWLCMNLNDVIDVCRDVMFIMFYLCVSLLLVTPCKCSTTHVTLKRFLPWNVSSMMFVFFSKKMFVRTTDCKKGHMMQPARPPVFVHFNVYFDLAKPCIATRYWRW